MPTLIVEVSLGKTPNAKLLPQLPACPTLLGGLVGGRDLVYQKVGPSRLCGVSARCVRARSLTGALSSPPADSALPLMTSQCSWRRCMSPRTPGARWGGGGGPRPGLGVGDSEQG